VYSYSTSGCGKYGKVALTDLLVRVTNLAVNCFSCISSYFTSYETLHARGGPINAATTWFPTP
jgi:hypothetical protein